MKCSGHSFQVHIIQIFFLWTENLLSCEFGRLGIDDELVSILGKWSPVCLLSLPLWKILQTVCLVISQALVMDCCKNLKSSSCVGKLLGMSVWVGQWSLTHTILMYFSFYLQFIVDHSSLHKANPSSLLLKSSKTVGLEDGFYSTAKVKKSVFLSIPTETSSSPDVYNSNNCFCANCFRFQWHMLGEWTLWQTLRESRVLVLEVLISLLEVLSTSLVVTCITGMWSVGTINSW